MALAESIDFRSGLCDFNRTYRGHREFRNSLHSHNREHKASRDGFYCHDREHRESRDDLLGHDRKHRESRDGLLGHDKEHRKSRAGQKESSERSWVDHSVRVVQEEERRGSNCKFIQQTYKKR